MTPTPDIALAARLAKLVQDEKYAADFQARSDAVIELRERLENAFDDGQLITLADHNAAVQAAVAKAVEAERDACAEVAAEFIHRRLYDAKMPACSYHSRDIAAAIRARKGDAL